MDVTLAPMGARLHLAKREVGGKTCLLPHAKDDAVTSRFATVFRRMPCRNVACSALRGVIVWCVFVVLFIHNPSDCRPKDGFAEAAPDRSNTFKSGAVLVPYPADAAGPFSVAPSVLKGERKLEIRKVQDEGVSFSDHEKGLSNSLTDEDEKESDHFSGCSSAFKSVRSTRASSCLKVAKSRLGPQKGKILARMVLGSIAAAVLLMLKKPAASKEQATIREITGESEEHKTVLELGVNHNGGVYSLILV